MKKAHKIVPSADGNLAICEYCGVVAFHDSYMLHKDYLEKLGAGCPLAPEPKQYGYTQPSWSPQFQDIKWTCKSETDET
jgi:hypothetical protein